MWQNLLHAVLGQLFQVICSRVPAENDAFRQQLNHEIPNTTAGAGLDMADQLKFQMRSLLHHTETLLPISTKLRLLKP